MILDLKFIILGSVLILILIPLYIYRKEIYKKFSNIGNTKFFIQEIKNYLTINYPKIKFNYTALNKFENEKDERVKQTLIVEELVKQYTYKEYELITQKTVPKNMLWSSYEQNSKLQKDNKLPNDWQQRKKIAWIRDKGQCNRCGLEIKLVDANALLAKQMKNGGGFNLENIVILCNDCTKIVKSSDLEKTRKDLNIIDKLMKITLF